MGGGNRKRPFLNTPPQLCNCKNGGGKCGLMLSDGKRSDSKMGVKKSIMLNLQPFGREAGAGRLQVQGAWVIG